MTSRSQVVNSRSLDQVKAMVSPSEPRREQRDKPSLSLGSKSRDF
jgi:hypothetical protein